MAGRIPQEFLDQLLSRVDITELVAARVPLRKTGHEYSACCPFHNERTPSFTVSPSKQFYHCFGCGAHGNAIGFLMEYERLGFLDAVEELSRFVGLELPRGVSTEQGGHNDLLALMKQAEHFFRQQLRTHPARQKAVDYLRRRGLDSETVTAFGIGYAPPGWDSLLKSLAGKGTALKNLISAGLAIEKNQGGCYDRFRDRIMFPIRDRRGRTIAFGGRTLGDATPKYMNSPETLCFHKGRELYGLYEAYRSERRLQRLLVVEGYLDVVALAQYGIRYAVATLGTATTPEHVERLFRITQDVIFCFDGDRAGRQAAWRALENTLPLLRDGHQAGFLFLPEGEDPDTLVRKEGKQAFEQRLAQALPLSDYVFDRLTEEVAINTLDGRARLVERARPLLNKLPDSVFRDMMIERLATIAKVSTARFNAPPPTKAPQGRANRNAKLTRTPVRLAIALLLNRTDLAQRAGDMGRFQGMSVPGLALLIQLVDLLQTCPHINVAALLERYRGTETGPILERLAQWQPEIPEALFEAEFLGALEHLERRYNREKQLLDKLVRGELSAEEKEMLRNLSRSSRVKI